MKEEIKLSDHFTYRRLFRFTLPSIAMSVFSSVYGIVDGFFVSNYAGKTAFSAINIILPYIMIMAALGFVFGAGGSALVGKTLGEGKDEKASKLFSMFVYVTVITGIVIAVTGAVTMRPVASLIGAEGELLELAVRYGRISMISITAFMLQMEFQSFCITAEKPKLGFAITVISGCTNMVLDYVLVGIFGLGLDGAAYATVASELTGGLLPVIYFAVKKDAVIRLTVFELDWKSLRRGIVNGLSEFVSSISMSLVGILYNFQLIRYAGTDGVAAYGVILYVDMVFQAIFWGYCMGTAPVVSFAYGADDREELKNMFRKGLVILGCGSLIMFTLAQTCAKGFSGLFVSYDAGLYALTLRGFRFFAFAYLFSGIGYFGSSFFTALNNGTLSALLAFSRTMVFQISTVLILPRLFDIDGIWLSLAVSEMLAMAMSVTFLILKRKKYGYA